jgi:hypothetical protein
VNTPSHAILNLALFHGRDQPAILAVVSGAVAPDIPLFIFYAWVKGVRRLPEGQIWTQAYNHPFWQRWIDWCHSIPLAGLAAWGCWCIGWVPATCFFISMILHSVGDLPVHHDDAHKHFLPVSQYRLMSPFSYWDPKHHGRTVALLEIILVLVASIFIFPTLGNELGQGLVIGINSFYEFTFGYTFLRRQLPNWFCRTGNA